jgi:hypothetical protein
MTADGRFAYNPAGNGRWVSLNLKRKKKAGGRRKKKVIEAQPRVREDDEDDGDGKNGDVDEEDGEHDDGDDVDVDMDDAVRPFPAGGISALMTGPRNHASDKGFGSDPFRTRQRRGRG